jgi:hypothetical protein
MAAATRNVLNRNGCGRRASRMEKGRILPRRSSSARTTLSRVSRQNTPAVTVQMEAWNGARLWRLVSCWTFVWLKNSGVCQWKRV